MLHLRRPSLLAGGGPTVGLLAAVLLSVPRVVEVQPSSGATGAPALPSISLTFSQPMRPDTVEGRLQLDPARPGTFRWTGRQMTFVPSQPWPEGAQVNVTLEGGALSLRGLPTFGATEWSFTVGAGRLAYLWPANETSGLYVWSSEVVEPQALVESPKGVIDFNLTQDGSSLVAIHQRLWGSVSSAGRRINRLLRLPGRFPLPGAAASPARTCLFLRRPAT
jgi:hypothetical protein